MRKLFILILIAGLALFIFGWKKSSKPKSSPASTPTSSQLEPKPAVPSKLPKFLQLAEEQGVVVAEAKEEKPGVVVITIIGRDNSEISRYLSEVQTNISLEDFDSNPPQFFTTEDGKRPSGSNF